MKYGIVSKLSAHLLTAVTSLSLASAQTVASQAGTTLRTGTVLRSRLEMGLRIGRPGQPITTTLIEPVYDHETLVIPAGATLHGEIASIKPTSVGHTKRLLSGDFTPPETVYVLFNELALPDGQKIPIYTDESVGAKNMQHAQFVPKANQPRIDRQLDEALMAPFRAPHKIQRFKKAMITSLPYHPDYLDQGTVYTAVLMLPMKIPLSAQAGVDTAPPDAMLHVHLVTPLTSASAVEGEQVKGTVSSPYYDEEKHIAVPEGSIVWGRVSEVIAAGPRKKNGMLLFTVDSARLPNGSEVQLHVTTSAVEAASDQVLTVDAEGKVMATTSRLAQGLSLVSLVSPAESTADSSTNNTAFERATQGNTGFGLLGAGAVQASSSSATSLAYFGAAKQIYEAYLAPGSDVVLPENTLVLFRDTDRPIALSHNDKRDPSVIWLQHQMTNESNALKQADKRLRRALRPAVSCSFLSGGLIACNRKNAYSH